jgi:DNA mismatch repair protein MutS
MAEELSHLRVYTMAISDDEQGEIVFLHRVTPGCIGRSYGVHVAKLAGMPLSIVRRAEEVLKHLESGKDSAVVNPVPRQNGHALVPVQFGVSSNGDEKRIAEGNGNNYEWQSEEARLVAYALEHSDGQERGLDAIDLCAITPLDALNLLYMMQKKRIH